MRELALAEIENVSGGFEDDSVQDNVIVQGSQIFPSTWDINNLMSSLFNHIDNGTTIANNILAGLGESAENVLDELETLSEEYEECPDEAVAYIMTGVGIDLVGDASVVQIDTSDGRSFLVFGAGVSVGLPGLEVGAGWATSSDVFEGWGFESGIALNAAVGASGGAFGIDDDAGTHATYGVEITGSATDQFPGVTTVDGFAFGPITDVPLDFSDVPAPTHCPTQN